MSRSPGPLERSKGALLLSRRGPSATTDRRGGTRYRVVAAGHIIACTIQGARYPSTIRLKALENGTLFAYYPDGIPKPVDQTGVWIAEHKRGRPVIVDGRIVEALLLKHIAINGAARPTAYRGTVTAACPPRLDLTGVKRGVCSLSREGLTIHAAISLVGSDWRVHQLDDVIKRSEVEGTATKHFAAQLLANGGPTMVVVTCPIPPVSVIAYPITLVCKLQANGNRPKRVTIHRESAVSYTGYDVEAL